MVLIYTVLFNRLSYLVSSSTELFLITMRRLNRAGARRHRTRTKRALRHPITRVNTSRIIRLYKVLVVDPRRPLTGSVRQVLFVTLIIIIRDLLRKGITGNLEGYRRGYIFTYFAAKRGVFRGIPLATTEPSLVQRNQPRFSFAFYFSTRTYNSTTKTEPTVAESAQLAIALIVF